MTTRLKKLPIFGEGINAKSSFITRQRRLNCYLEVRKDGDKAKIVCLATPGLVLAFTANTPLQLPVRAMIGNDTALYIAAGNQVSSVSSTGSTIATGTIGTATGRMELALNPTQVMIVDGAAGYVFTPSTGALVLAGGAFPNGALTVIYCNGFFICEQPGTNQFFVSAFNDGTTWNGLSFASAVQAIDGIMACDQLGGLLLIFSSGHLEFWQNQGLTQEPFVYIQNSAAMYGLAAVGGRCHGGDSLFFLARTNGGSFLNSTGSYQICQVKGYSVKVVSTTDIDHLLQRMAKTSTIADCTAYSYQQDEHIFAQFNFPTADRSLLYDMSTQLWSEVQTGVTPNYATRHIGNYAAQAYKTTLVSDASNANIYTLDPTARTDNGNVIVREVVTRCAMEDLNVMTIAKVRLDMAVGVGLTSSTAQGYEPMMSQAIARDSRDFGPERLVKLGRKGQYSTIIETRRWGRGRTINFRLRVTDPVEFEINSAALMVRSRSSSSQGKR